MSGRHSSLTVASFKMAAIVLAQNGILAAILLYAPGEISVPEIAGIATLIVALALATAVLMRRTMPEPATEEKQIVAEEAPRRFTSIEEIALQASEMERLSGGHIARLIVDMGNARESTPENSRDIEIEATHDRSLKNALEKLTHVVEALDGGMRRLAAGDLTVRLDQPFPERFEGLRGDFNHALKTIEDTLSKVGTGVRTLHTACAMTRDDFMLAAGAGARQSAAIARTLTEIGGLSETLRARKMQAEHTANIAHNARADMYRPKQAIGTAATAMDTIRDAALKIEAAAAAIRELAFQANMLAVNASIEAAHGEAAPARAAAQEIRGLAERAAEAAREISLLSRSVTEATELGVRAVEKAGGELDAAVIYTEALKDHADIIATSSQREIESVAALRMTVMAIAKAGREQVSTLDELSGQIGGMEREAAALDQHAGRFAPETVIVPEGISIPESRKILKRGAHLRLVKS